VGRRHDDRPIERRRSSLQPKIRILVVCEGRKTEPRYIKEFQHHVRNLRVHIEPLGPAGVPVTVVETAISEKRRAEDRAKRERDENLRWDQVWAVFDMDDHPNVDDAKQLAIDNDISLAVSNPCFELWAVLHFVDQRAHIERGKLRAELKKHLPAYDKELDFATVHVGYDDAIQRAQSLDKSAAQTGRPGGNPTTGIYLLTEMIRTR
jgi:hypothetical protein